MIPRDPLLDKILAFDDLVGLALFVFCVGVVVTLAGCIAYFWG
jgi:hypothetical protein